jgi:hypothetical protein
MALTLYYHPFSSLQLEGLDPALRGGHAVHGADARRSAGRGRVEAMLIAPYTLANFQIGRAIAPRRQTRRP